MGEVAVAGYRYDSTEGLTLRSGGGDDGDASSGQECSAKMINLPGEGVRGITVLGSSPWELVAGTASGIVFVWDGRSGARRGTPKGPPKSRYIGSFWSSAITTGSFDNAEPELVDIFNACLAALVVYCAVGWGIMTFSGDWSLLLYLQGWFVY